MPRAAIADVAISISSLINFNADFYRITEAKSSKSEGFKLVCPVCEPVTKPAQKYICPSCSDQFSSGELGKAREINKTLVRVTADEVDNVRSTELPRGELSLSPYKADEVLATIHPDGITYRIQATKFRNIATMATDLVASCPDVMFLGQMNVGRGSEKVFSLAVWNGTLIAQEMARPDEMLDFEPVPESYDNRLLEPAKAFIALQATSFTEDEFASKRKARIAELDAAKSGDVPADTTVPTTKPVSETDNLLAMLEAQIAASKAS
jgi:non-homologous end joining protein Ku